MSIENQITDTELIYYQHTFANQTKLMQKKVNDLLDIDEPTADDLTFGLHYLSGMLEAIKESTDNFTKRVNEHNGYVYDVENQVWRKAEFFNEDN